MPLSSNGWAVLAEAPPPVTIPGTGHPGIALRIREGDVATVLAYVAGRFHTEVEKLDKRVSETPGYDDWGWAYRPVRGQTKGFSNHASGTAIDLNSTRHPRGVTGTFTPEQKRLVRRILATTFDAAIGRNVVRWGEDYSTVIDGMHFEINADEAPVARVARRIRERDNPRPAPAPTTSSTPVKEARMFMARAKGDSHVFLFTGDGRRYVPTPAIYRELHDICKVPDVGELSVALVNLFPILPNPSEK